MGKGYVPCLVSGRWIQFPEKSGEHIGAGEPILLSIMTNSHKDDIEKTRKITDLIVTREDLKKAINSVTDPDKGRK